MARRSTFDALRMRHRRTVAGSTPAEDGDEDGRLGAEDEPESLAELLASEYGIAPQELLETELFESFLDAMEADAWRSPGRGRVIN